LAKAQCRLSAIFYQNFSGFGEIPISQIHETDALA